MIVAIPFIKLLGTLGTVILAGCGSNNSSVVDEDKPSIETESWRIFACNEEVVKYLNITTFGGWWNWEEEAWASFVLDWEITYEQDWETIIKNVQCVVDMVDKSVTIQEVSDEEVSEEMENEEVDTNIDEVNNDEAPVAKMRISDDLTQEEIENQINETCGNMWGTWEEGSCVLEDWNVVQF